jgi:hypothetical protein
VNGWLRNQGQRQALDFHFCSGAFFKIGNNSGPVSVYVEKNRCHEKQRSKNDGDNYNQTKGYLLARGHADSSLVPGESSPGIQIVLPSEQKELVR